MEVKGKGSASPCLEAGQSPGAGEQSGSEGRRQKGTWRGQRGCLPALKDGAACEGATNHCETQSQRGNVLRTCSSGIFGLKA